MKNFRESSNIILKDIYATDELKRKTLEKCANKDLLKVKPLLALTASAAILIATLGVSNYFSHKPTIDNNYVSKSIKHEYKNSIHNENPKEPSKIAENNDFDKSNYSSSNNKINDKTNNKTNNKTNIKNQNSTLQNKNSNTNTVTSSTNTSSKNANNSSQDTSNTTKHLKSPDSISQNGVDTNENMDTIVDPSATYGLTSSPQSLSMTDAEKYFESKILLPSNIPEGFNLTNVSIPDDKLKCIKLKYSSNSNFFEILQNKNLSELKGTKIISIENNKAYISTIKDEESNITITTISWIMNNVQYSLSGNIPDNSLINIANSIN